MCVFFFSSFHFLRLFRFRLPANSSNSIMYPWTQLEKFRNHNSQWLCMVESQQHEDNTEDYQDEEDEEHDLDNYLRSEYLDNCDLYNSNSNTNKENEDQDESNSNSNNPASPANSSYSRPVSR